MANPILAEIVSGLKNGDVKRDIIDNFAAKEKEYSIQLGDATRGNLAGLEGRDKVVADALKELRKNIDYLSPANFKPSFWDKLFGKTKESMKDYFARFKDNQTFLNELLQKLEEGKQTLLRDNIALDIEVNKNRELEKAISEKLQLALEANGYLESKLQQLGHIQPSTQVSGLLENQSSPTSAVDSINQSNILEIEATITKDPLAITQENAIALQNNIIFPLRQQIMDFQQQILVLKQGIVALTTIINNNKELASSVDRTKAVTLNALNTAIITAQGLEQQQRVLQAVQGINDQTSNLIAHTSEQLKMQGAQIQTQASSTMLDMDKIKLALDNVLTAMDEVENFRVKSLPKMQSDINQYQAYLDELKKRSI